jgi:hypothetical protein
MAIVGTFQATFTKIKFFNYRVLAPYGAKDRVLAPYGAKDRVLAPYGAKDRVLALGSEVSGDHRGIQKGQ